MSKYTPEQFDQELQAMLKKARNNGDDLVRVLSKDLHDRVVSPDEANHRMPMTCNAMWKLWKQQGSHVDRIADDNSREKFSADGEKRHSSTVVIIFATS